MKDFNKRFNKGDIICSDKFSAGKCVIVDRFSPYSNGYKTEDLVIPNQGWIAHEEDDWRLSTDEDIIGYLTRFMKKELGNINGIKIIESYDSICIDSGGDNYVYLYHDEVVELYKLLQTRIK